MNLDDRIVQVAALADSVFAIAANAETASFQTEDVLHGIKVLSLEISNKLMDIAEDYPREKDGGNQ